MSRILASYISAMNEDFIAYCSQHLAQNGISHGQITFIMYIGENPNCTQTQLAAAVNADSGYTTRLVKKLVDSGLANKQKQQTDARASMLRLTNLGMQRYQECLSLYEHWEAQVTCGLDDVERQMLLQLLAKMHNTISTSS